MLKRLLTPRSSLPMGFALGLIVLWQLGALPTPFGSNPGPILAAVYAVVLAIVGAGIGFGIQWAMARMAPKDKP